MPVAGDRRGGAFDLVLCNILARPLKRLAGDLARHLAPGGTVILAGLLSQDGADVLAAHRAVGLRPAGGSRWTAGRPSSSASREPAPSAP
ncbi:MAG: 50S ribosomal protein L11 methyltransferase [Rhodospirillales bacterium]